MFSISCVGRTGDHILLTYNQNEAFPGPGAIAPRREFPNLADGSNNCVCGNSGRNILYGPGTEQFDASLFKDLIFSSDGSRRLQFRAETFNIFNTPQFNNPNASIGTAAAGTISSAGAPVLFQRTSREIQLAMKLYW